MARRPSTASSSPSFHGTMVMTTPGTFSRERRRRRALWFVGNEARGFAGYDFDVDARVAVPLYGKAESLNVSTALAVCVYASAMAQRAD